MSVFDLLEEVYTRLRGLGPPSHEEKLVANFGPGNPSGPIMDLGGGSGAHSAFLAGQDVENIHVVDINWSALRRSSLHPALHRTTARAEALPFRNSVFRGVFLIDVLHHVADQASALREISRVLAAGGVILIIEYHRTNPIVRIFSLLSVLRGKRCSFFFPAELLALARRCGLQGAIVDSDGLRFTARIEKD